MESFPHIYKYRRVNKLLKWLEKLVWISSSRKGTCVNCRISYRTKVMSVRHFVLGAVKWRWQHGHDGVVLPLNLDMPSNGFNSWMVTVIRCMAGRTLKRSAVCMMPGLTCSGFWYRHKQSRMYIIPVQTWDLPLTWAAPGTSSDIFKRYPYMYECMQDTPSPAKTCAGSYRRQTQASLSF